MQSKTEELEIEANFKPKSLLVGILNLLTSIGFIVLILISNFVLVPILFGKSISDSYIYWSYFGIGLVLFGGFGKIFVKFPEWINSRHKN